MAWRVENDAPATLRDYLEVARRRKWIILQAVILIPLVAVVWSLRQSPLYSASAAVLLNTQNLAANLEGVSDPTQYDPDRLLKTQVELARVPELARRTERAAGLKNWDASQLLGMSSVSSGSQSDFLTFSVASGNRELAVRLATEYARQYTRYRYQLDTQALRTARASVTRRMQKLRAAGAQGSALYSSLFEKKDQLDTLQSLLTARALLVRAASGAGQIQPQPKKNAAFGIVLGLFLGLGLAALLEALDSRVRSSEAIVERLGLRLLGRVPRPPRFRGKDKPAMLVDPTGPEAEAFWVLRTNMELANVDEGAHTIMVTSAAEKEGKSTTAANLAIALARAGRRVVLVDLDFRNPSLHRFFGLASTPGITDMVLRGVALDRAITRVDVGSGSFFADDAPSESRGRWGTPEATAAETGRGQLGQGKLEVLPAGTSPINPGQLVAQLPIGPILQVLKERSSIVLIDGPPLLRVGDAMALSSAVDALLVVARLNVVRAPMLDDLSRMLRTCPAAKLGLVIAGAEIDPSYGYLSYPRNRREAVV
jgi:Mrp family chromosome partitioning ATPase/capsular polysaccharide biosynthesis protein